MKTKTLAKKLNLKKNTVAHLEDKDMEHVQGGALTLKLCLTTFPTNSCVSYPCC